MPRNIRLAGNNGDVHVLGCIHMRIIPPVLGLLTIKFFLWTVGFRTHCSPQSCTGEPVFDNTVATVSWAQLITPGGFIPKCLRYRNPGNIASRYESILTLLTPLLSGRSKSSGLVKIVSSTLGVYEYWTLIVSHTRATWGRPAERATAAFDSHISGRERPVSI